MQWAQQQKFKKPFVIGAIIETGNCLDLTDANSLSILKKIFEPFKSAWGKITQAPLPQNKSGRHYLDCAVINFLHGTRAGLHDRGSAKLPDDFKYLAGRPFDTVRGVFTEGEPLFLGSEIMEKTHIQIAVRNPQKSILGYFKPRDPDFLKKISKPKRI